MQRLGYTGSQLPEILEHAFMRAAGQVANVVDDRPLSETSPIRAYTDDGRNYIQWLIDAASDSLDDVVAERDFSDDVSPQTLLYLFLRHGVMLGYYDTSYRLHRTAGFLSATELAAMKPEPTFVHVADAPAGGASESRFAALYKTEPRITSNQALLVSDYITANLPDLPDGLGLWRKVKVRAEEEFVIGGYTAPGGARTHFGAILVGAFEGDRLRYAGKVGTGFTGKTLADLAQRFARLRRATSPFVDAPRMRDATWLEPRLVAQIGFMEKTGDGKLRHPVFLGLREDKAAGEVRWTAQTA